MCDCDRVGERGRIADTKKRERFRERERDTERKRKIKIF